MAETKSLEKQDKPLITGGIDLVGQSFGIFSKKWKKLVWLLFLIPLIVTGISFFVGIFFAIMASLVVATKIFLVWKIVLAVILGLIGLACILFSIFISIVANISAIYVIDQDLGIKEALKKSLPVFWKYLGLAIIFGIIIVIGYLLFIIPGIILTVMLSFSLYALVLEDLGPIQALKRSKELVKGFWWTVLARFMVVGVFAILISIVSSMINSLGTNLIEAGSKNPGMIVFAAIFAIIAFVISVAINFVINSIVMIYTYLIYGELKKQKNSDASIKDAMSKGKKVGLGILVAIFAVVAVSMILILTIVASMDLGSANLSSSGNLISTSTSTSTDITQFQLQNMQPQPASPKTNQ